MVDTPLQRASMRRFLPVTGGMHVDAWAQPEVLKQIFDFFDAHKKKG